jgi:cell division protease FtsH
MTTDAWLPIGYTLPDGAKSKMVLFEGGGWQILETQGNGRALVVQEELLQRWITSEFLADGAMTAFEFGNKHLHSISCGASQILCPVWESESPNTKNEALAFSLTFKATREIDNTSPLQDALYVEKISRLLPTYSISQRVDDDIILGYWLTGGANISVNSFRRLCQYLSWLNASDLKNIVEIAGFRVADAIPLKPNRTSIQKQDNSTEQLLESYSQDDLRIFELPGRMELASFINEHIVDIIQNRKRYKALGIEFPSAIVLHGPPGCGKTFAVERLVDFLGWACFQIDASSVASPYIHETSKKVADVFDQAMNNAPSVLVIDEMEAFLADREMGSGHHRVEEVAEFLRRIPEATKNQVLIIGMTNRIEMIDPAILRRGRFDHIIEVDFANAEEILSLLEKLLSSLPKDENVDATIFANELAGRPLSDVAFVVREGARLAARSGKDKLDQKSLQDALNSAPAREREGRESRRIGFI